MVIFLLGAVLRAGLLMWSADNHPASLYDDDSYGYIQLSQNVLEHRGFSEATHTPYFPNSFRTPGYPMFLLLNKIVFSNYFAALVLQIILSLVIAYMIILIADAYLTIEIGLIASTIFLLMPFSVMAPLRYLTQILFTTLLMIAVWFWLLYLERRRSFFFYTAALLLPLTALVRPIAMFLYAPFLASLFFLFIKKRVSLRDAFVKGLLLILIFFAVLAPWMLRNYKVFGHFQLSSITPAFLYFYEAPAVYAIAHKVSFAEARAFLEQDIARYSGGTTYASSSLLFSEFSPLTSVLNERAAHYLFEDKLAFVKARIILFCKFFIRDGIRYWFEDVGRGVSERVQFFSSVLERLILLILAVGFFVYLIKAFRRFNVPLMTLCLVVLYFASLTGVMASAGLRYPAEPIILLLGVAGLKELGDLFKIKFTVREVSKV